MDSERKTCFEELFSTLQKEVDKARVREREIEKAKERERKRERERVCKEQTLLCCIYILG